MKTLLKIAPIAMLVVSLTSCGGGTTSSSSSSDGVFDGIPETIAKWQTEKDELRARQNSDNYQKMDQKVDELDKEMKEKIREEAEALNGKELEVTVNTDTLKIESPVTLVFASMNAKAPNMEFGGTVVAATDLTLNCDPNDLKSRKMLSGTTYYVEVRMPVSMDFLDKDGNVVYHRSEVGTLNAENLETSAVVKAGTAVDFKNRQFTISDKMGDVTHFHMYVDITKTPYYNSVSK